MPDVNLSPYTAQAAQIEQRRKMAEMLSQQAMQPMENQMAGGYVIPTSPFAGLAKVLQSYAGAKGQKTAADEQMKLAERYRGDQMGDMTALAKMLASPGAPAQPEQWMSEGIDERLQPATAARRPGQIDPEMMGQFKTPEGVQMAMAQLLAQMKPAESLFGKVDPKDYTPQSIREFATTKDPSVLVPVRKKEIASFGGVSGAYDPYAIEPGQVFEHTVGPDTAARLRQDDFQWRNLSPYQQGSLQNASIGNQISATNAANTGINTQFNTGQGAMPPRFPAFTPQAPQMPPQAGQAAPQQPPVGQPAAIPPVSRPNPAQIPPQGAPVAAPRAATPPGMTGATAQALMRARGEMDAKRDFNMGGLNAALDEAETLLTGAGKKSPTSSGVGSLVDTMAGWVGVSPNGAPEAAKLKAIGGALVAKMPRMEGPQSDKDVMMYREMAGLIGDDTVPIARRLAALNTVRTLYAKYDKGPQAGGASGGWGIRPIP